MPGTQRFFVICLILALALLIAVPLRGGLFAPRTISASAARGWQLWQRADCGGCHTLEGQGVAYASDLTHVISARGASDLRDVLSQPRAAEMDALRIMPPLDLTDADIDALLAFLQTVDARAGAFPPHPLSVAP